MKGKRTWTEHLLPFERLSPDDFQGVFQWLLTEEGYENVRNLGEGGSDEGCDLVADWKGRRVVLQCKRTRQLGPKAAVREVEKILTLPAGELPDEYVLAASCTLTLKTERAVRARAAEAFKCVFWALRELDERVRRHPRIVERFFRSAFSSVSGRPAIPPATRDFTGRSHELEELSKAIREHGGALIYGVRGLGGIGKTEVGLKLVETVGNDYPDGHILVELGGASDHPLSCADAMVQVIRAYNPETIIPEKESELLSFYHRVLKNRRAIVFLDDAASADQVKPLLPHPRCLTLVTSRQRFPLPRLHRLDLDALTQDAARDLLLKLAPRLGAEAERIADLLGGLPLALRLAGGAFAERPDLEPVHYIRKLERPTARVGLVDAAIEFNYQSLKAEVQQLWAALSVFAGAFDLEATSAIWGLDLNTASDILGDLLKSSLIEWTRNRYRLHDLVRLFAADCLAGEHKSLIQERHSTHFLDQLLAGYSLYIEGGESLANGLLLIDQNLKDILAGQEWAAKEPRRSPKARRLAKAYADLLPCISDRLSPRKMIDWCTAGARAARLDQDCSSEARHLNHLSLAHRSAGDSKGSIKNSRVALRLFRNSEDREGEGIALYNLAETYRMSAKLWRAQILAQSSLELAERTNNRHIQGMAICELGLITHDIEDFRGAIEYYQQYLQITRESGDRAGEGMALGNLGLAFKDIGDSKRALDYFRADLDIAREIGDRRGESRTLGNLGCLLAETGKVEESLEMHRRHLAVAVEIGDLYGEANARRNCGVSNLRLGAIGSAIKDFQHDLEYSRSIGNRRREIESLQNLGAAYSAKREDLAQAVACYCAALDIANKIEDPGFRLRILGAVANTYADLKDHRRAVDFFQEGIKLARDSGRREAEAEAWWNLGVLCEESGRYADAIEAMQYFMRFLKEVHDQEAIEALAQRIAGLKGKVLAEKSNGPTHRK